MGVSAIVSLQTMPAVVSFSSLLCLQSQDAIMTLTPCTWSSLSLWSHANTYNKHECQDDHQDEDGDFLQETEKRMDSQIMYFFASAL